MGPVLQVATEMPSARVNAGQRDFAPKEKTVDAYRMSSEPPTAVSS